MVRIKIFIAFVLAAAAIAPVVALPICEGREFTGHHHHHHHHVASPEQPSPDSTTSTPSAREYVNELEVRSHGHGHPGRLRWYRKNSRKRAVFNSPWIRNRLARS